MNKKVKFLITVLSTLFFFGILFWDHFHGGVPSHHILNNEKLPAISNWWGGLFIPVLTWILLGRIERRMNKSIQLVPINKLVDRPWIIFVFGLCLGVLLAVAFEFEYQILLNNIPFALILISLFIPIFYAEFILGFVLGMTYTFGAILPTAFILIFACIGYLIYRFIRPMILKLIRKFNKQPTRNAKP